MSTGGGGDCLTVEKGIKYPEVEISLVLISKAYKTVGDIDRELLKKKRREKWTLA